MLSRLHEWMNAWMNKWMNVLKSEWVNEFINERMNNGCENETKNNNNSNKNFNNNNDDNISTLLIQPYLYPLVPLWADAIHKKPLLSRSAICIFCTWSQTLWRPETMIAPTEGCVLVSSCLEKTRGCGCSERDEETDERVCFREEKGTSWRILAHLVAHRNAVEVRIQCHVLICIVCWMIPWPRIASTVRRR